MNANQFSVTGILQPVFRHILPVASNVREEESAIGKDPKILILPTYSRKLKFYYFSY